MVGGLGRGGSSGLLAGRDGFPSGHACLLGRLGGDPRGIGLEGEALERRGKLGGGGPVLLGLGVGITRREVDPVDLGEPVAGGGLDCVTGGRGGTGCAKRRLGRLLGRSDRPRICGGGRVLALTDVVVVVALGLAKALGGLPRAVPRPGRDRTAFVGDATLIGARAEVGRRGEAVGRPGIGCDGRLRPARPGACRFRQRRWRGSAGAREGLAIVAVVGRPRRGRGARHRRRLGVSPGYGPSGRRRPDGRHHRIGFAGNRDPDRGPAAGGNQPAARERSDDRTSQPRGHRLKDGGNGRSVERSGIVGLRRRRRRLASFLADRRRPGWRVAVARIGRVVRLVLGLDPAPIRRTAAGRAGGLILLGERGRPRSDAVRGDGHANLGPGPRSGPRHLDQSGSHRDAEHQPKRQEGELARGHVGCPPRSLYPTPDGGPVGGE